MSGEGGKSTARSFLPVGIQIHWVRTNSQTNRVCRIENPPKFDSWSHPTRKQLTTSPNFFSLIVFSIEEQSQQPRALGSSQGGQFKSLAVCWEVRLPQFVPLGRYPLSIPQRTPCLFWTSCSTGASSAQNGQFFALIHLSWGQFRAFCLLWCCVLLWVPEFWDVVVVLRRFTVRNRRFGEGVVLHTDELRS